MPSTHDTEREHILPLELEDAIDAAVLRLVLNFGVFTDEAALTVLTDTWERAAARQAHWLTAEWVDGALDIYLDRKTDNAAERKVPPVGDFIDVCRAVKDATERRARPALPTPQVQPSRPDAKAFAWNVAIGRARMRNRRRLIDDYRRANGMHQHAPVPESVWRGQDEPTDAEIRAVLAETSARAAGMAAVATQTPPAWSDLDERALLERYPHLKDAKV